MEIIPVPACRVSPLLKIFLYASGSAPYFGVNSDYGFSWYSRLNEEFSAGTASYNTVEGVLGVPVFVPCVEYLGVERIRTLNRSRDHEVPIGLCLHPFAVPQDVGLWTEAAGSTAYSSFSYSRAMDNPPVLGVSQKFDGVDSSGNTVAGAVWASRSDDAHPANASFAFRLTLPEVSPDYDVTAGGVPYVQVGWSGGLWAVRFYDNGNPILFKNTSSGLVPIMELGAPEVIRRGSDDPDEVFFIVRCQRGGLLLSSDNGATYDVWWEPGNTAVSVPAGKWTFQGQGRSARLEIHQVVYLNSTYTSPHCPTDRSRDTAPTVRTVKGRNYTNTGYSAVSVGPSLAATYMQYRITLTAGTVTAALWDFHFSPEVYTVEMGWPTVPSFFVIQHDFGLTFEGRIKRLQITKPLDVAESSCSWTARYTVAEGGPIIPLGLAEKMVKVYGGWLYDDGTNDVVLMHTGHITGVSLRQINSVTVEMDIETQNTSLRAKRQCWRDGQCVPYDGLTPNQCLLKWANSMGLNYTFIQYDYTGRGDTLTIPDLFPESPSALPAPGEERWEFLAELGKKVRLELGVLDTGSYAWVPSDTYFPSPYVWNANADPVADTQSPVLDSEYEQMVLDTFTGIQVRGRTMWNQKIGAWIRDVLAEEDILSSRFRPWPEWHVETVEEPTTQGWLNQTALGLAYNKITPRFDRAWKGYLANQLSRRDAVYVRGLTDGGGSVNIVGVHEITHVFDKADTMQAYTTVRGRKLL